MKQQLNIRVSSDTKKALKIEALEEGLSLEVLVSEILENYLKDKEKEGNERKL